MLDERRTPRLLHEVLGERFVPLELVVIAGFGASIASLALASLQPSELSLPSAIIAWLLIADIGAGCVANFTRGTNEFYAARPRHRWLFIALHVHVLVLAFVLGEDLTPAIATRCYTVVAASVVNALRGTRAARFVAGALLAGGIGLLMLLEVPAALGSVYALFTLKLAYAFAVDHEAPRA